MYNKEKDDLCIKKKEELLPLLPNYIDMYAFEKPGDIAIVEFNTGEEVSWKDFHVKTKAFAAKLNDMGLKKGDVVATTLPLLKEHVFIMFACFRIGVIIAPLDLRLKPREVRRCFENIQPKAYFFLGKTEVADFRPMVADLMDEFTSCEHWIQFDLRPDLIIRGAISIIEFAMSIEKTLISALLTGSIKKRQNEVETNDPALIIFTTGSTGFPKPALISQRNILIQNIGLEVAFDISCEDVMCVNLPASHVGCVTEQLCTTVFVGGTAVILHIFDAVKTLEAIQKYEVSVFGQIPALFAMQWQLPNYEKYDLSSLKFALYGGQAVSREFLERLSNMAPKFGTGLGLTETAGFVTYTPLDGTIDDILSSVGFDCPLCPISIRKPMKNDGTAGEEKEQGEIGEICFSGDQIFLGYLNDKENTRKTVSTDGYCYTGDLGYYDEKGLHFAGRSKLLIKPKGYQVFPTEVENFIEEAFPEIITNVGCVGVEHKIYSEAIIAFVGVIDREKITSDIINKKSKELAAYKRPSHFVFIEAENFPLNRVAKTDYVILKKRAENIIEGLRKEGKWDN